VKALILFKGSATDKILKQLRITNYELRMEIKKDGMPIIVVDNMKDALRQAQGFAKKGDIILLSPGAASFGIFKNEFDRGEQFNKIVKKLR
jgi:UDP-N-acetylmuramoylalanine--D-glutamate ligase